jgi:hypothetical protein
MLVSTAQQTVSKMTNRHILLFCHSGLDPESRVFSDCYATRCRIKSGITEKLLDT